MKSLLQQIGDYRIIEKLGRGGMSDVYLAFDGSSQRRIALKLVERGPGEDAGEIVAAERLGAELQAHLSAIEPRVPRIHKFGELEDYFFIDMEYVEGRDLSEIIRAGALTPDVAANIARELCSILANAHAITLHADGREFRAIVHGDIKPRNIRIEVQGQVRVLDFGIAKGLSLTRRLTANLFGSVAYSSPERLETGRIDEMSDLWSVGIVLYEMMEGRLPFEAASTERLETIIRSQMEPRPFTREWPPELAHVLHKALARASGRRYRSAEEFAADLTSFLAGVPTRAGEESEDTRRTTVDAGTDQDTCRTFPVADGAVQGSAPMTPETASARTPAKRARRNQRAILIWAGVSAFILLAGIGIWQGRVYGDALRLRKDLVSSPPEPDAAWSQYEELHRRSLWGIADYPVRKPLETILRENALKVIDDYRNSDQPKARLGDWVRCKRYLAHAVEVDPKDPRIAAMLAYADGHVLRINNKGLGAIASFQRAIQYDPQWTDPYLGMARTYIYGLKDMERGTQALQRAKDLGHPFGKRELAMMADAYNYGGMQAWDGAKRLRGSDQEKELLKKSQENLRQAIATYTQIVPWGESTKQILSVQQVLDNVDERLKELNPPNPLFPWNWFKKLLY